MSVTKTYTVTNNTSGTVSGTTQLADGPVTYMRPAAIITLAPTSPTDGAIQIALVGTAMADAANFVVGNTINVAFG